MESSDASNETLVCVISLKNVIVPQDFVIYVVGGCIAVICAKEPAGVVGFVLGAYDTIVKVNAPAPLYLT